MTKPKTSIWKDAPTELTRKEVFKLVYGPTSTGRTTYALTAPGPIALLHASEKVEGIVQRAAQDREVKILDFGTSLSGTQQQQAQQADRAWKMVMEALDDAWTWARTIVIDTSTELWEFLRMARFGKLTQVMPHNYGPVYAEWRATLKKAFRDQQGTNLILVGQEKELYKNDKPQGKMIPAGQKSDPYDVDVSIRTSRGKKGEFKGEIIKGWYEASVEGMELEDDLYNFPSVMQLITGQDWST